MEAALDELYAERFVKHLGSKMGDLANVRIQFKQLSHKLKTSDESARQQSLRDIELVAKYARFLEWMACKRGEIDSFSEDLSNSDPKWNLEAIQNLFWSVKAGEASLNDLRKSSGTDLCGVDVASAENQHRRLLELATDALEMVRNRADMERKMGVEYENILCEIDTLESNVSSLMKEPITLYEHVHNMSSRAEKYHEDSKALRTRLGEIDGNGRNEPELLTRIKDADNNIQTIQCHLGAIRGAIERTNEIKTKLEGTTGRLVDIKHREISRNSVDALLGYKEDVDILLRTAQAELGEYDQCWTHLESMLEDSQLSFEKNRAFPNRELTELLHELTEKSANIDNIISKLEQFNKLETDVISFISSGEQRLYAMETKRNPKLGEIKELLQSVESFEDNVVCLRSMISHLGNMPVPFSVSSQSMGHYDSLLSRAKALFESHKEKMGVIRQSEKELDQLKAEVTSCEPVLDRSISLNSKLKLLYANLQSMADIGTRIESFAESVQEDDVIRDLLNPRLEKLMEKYHENAANISKMQKAGEDELAIRDQLCGAYHEFYDYLTTDLDQSIQLLDSAKLREIEEAEKWQSSITTLLQQLRTRRRHFCDLESLDENTLNSADLGKIKEMRDQAEALASGYQAKLGTMRDRSSQISHEWTKLNKKKKQLHLELTELGDHVSELNEGNETYFEGQNLSNIREQLLDLLKERGQDLFSLDDAYNHFSLTYSNVESRGLEDERHLYRSLLGQLKSMALQDKLSEMELKATQCVVGMNVDTQTWHNVGVQMGRRSNKGRGRRTCLIKAMIQSVRETQPIGAFDKKYGNVLQMIGESKGEVKIKLKPGHLAREYLADVCK